MARQMTGLIDKVTAALTAANQGGASKDTIEAVTQQVSGACDRHRAATTQVQTIKST